MLSGKCVVFEWAELSAWTIKGTHVPYGGKLCNMGQELPCHVVVVHHCLQHQSFHSSFATLALQGQY